MRFLSFTILFILTLQHTWAGKKGKPREPEDTLLIYHHIEKFSVQYPTTKYLYGLVLNPIDTTLRPQKPKKLELNKTYTEYEGKIIRQIKITTLDPFGYSVRDSTVNDQNIILHAGNKVHKKTMRVAIRNLLLFRKNQPLDPLRVKESERLIRSQGFVHDVDITISPTSANSDSVDIYIRELDKWSLSPRLSLTPSSLNAKLTEKNFFGTGHEVYFDFYRHYETNSNAYQTKYSIPTFRNSYINGSLFYNLDQYKNSDVVLTIDRPFYSALARWAGGFECALYQKDDSILFNNSEIYVPFNTNFYSQDYWAGRSFQLFKGKSEYNRTSNIILSARYLHLHYMEKPDPIYDPNQINSDEDFILGGLGFSSRQYIQKKYVFDYGLIEDVPVGFVFGFTGGYQYKNHTERLYTGARMAYGKAFRWGFLSTNLEYGTYFRALEAEQSAINADISYFTNLVMIGNWRFRQFIRPQVVFGLNRFETESLTLNDENGIRGFDSPILKGNQKALLSLQTQSYAPWRWVGFRFGPYFTSTFGVISDKGNSFANHRIYSQFGVGCLIKNDFLVFNTFQISFAYYPTIPGQAENSIKQNPITTTDYSFTNFELGKPVVVGYK